MPRSAEPVDEGGGRVGPQDQLAQGLEVVGVPPRTATDLEHRSSGRGLGNLPEECPQRRPRGAAGLDVELHGDLVGREGEVDRVWHDVAGRHMSPLASLRVSER